MGTFSASIFADDLALDVRNEYLDLLASGYDDRAACRTVENAWKDSIADIDDGPIFWLALAAIQWEYGRLDDRVKRRALHIISVGKDARRWLSSPQAQRRQQILQRLKEKLQLAQPKRRTPRHRLVRDPDSLSVKSQDDTAEATAWSLDGQAFCQVYVTFRSKHSEGGGGVFTAHCHCTAIRMKWVANDHLQISYRRTSLLTTRSTDYRYYRRTTAIKIPPLLTVRRNE